MIDGVNNSGKVNQPDGEPVRGGAKKETELRSFDPEAQVIPSEQSDASVKARLGLNDNQTVEVEGIGLVNVTDDSLNAFANRVAQGVLAQEHAIVNTAKVFGAGDKVLEDVISSTLAA